MSALTALAAAAKLMPAGIFDCGVADGRNGLLTSGSAPLPPLPAAAGAAFACTVRCGTSAAVRDKGRRIVRQWLAERRWQWEQQR